MVKLDEPHTGPISELTPDPKTYVTATVQCPHMPDAKFVSWNEFGRLPEMLATLIQHEAGLERDWAPRVTTYQ